MYWMNSPYTEIHTYTHTFLHTLHIKCTKLNKYPIYRKTEVNEQQRSCEANIQHPTTKEQQEQEHTHNSAITATEA